MSNELALTLRRACLGPEPRLTAAARKGLAGAAADGRLGELVELAQLNRATPWVAAAIAADPELAGDPTYRPFIQAASGLSLRSLDLFAELSRLVAVCNEGGVDVIVLKGPAVSRQFYPEPGLRTYGDIDILIHERDLDAVSGLLEGWGYRLKEGMDEDPHRLHDCHGIFQRIFIHPDRGRTIEVHCDHLQIGLEPVGMADIWERAQEMRFGRGVARVLEPTDLFLQLCVHLHRHGFERLIWFKDLDLMVRSAPLDWDALREQAIAQGCLDSVSYTLHLLRRMLGTRLPAPAARIAAGQSFVSRWMMKLTWPPANTLSLQPQRRGRLRRAVQFAPEDGLRGGVGSLVFVGRRSDKLRVGWAALRGARPGRSNGPSTVNEARSG